MKENTGLIISCPLCDEHSCHVIGAGEAQIMQCINCGYVSSNKYIGDKDTNEEYKKLEPDMQQWAKEELGRIWIPTIMTLPTGLIYPFNDDDKMRWGYAKMVQISEEEKEDYPIPGQEDKYYTQRYDMENPRTFDEFIFAMAELQNELKEGGDGSKNISLSK